MPTRKTNDFILQDPERSIGAARDDMVRRNRDAFAWRWRARRKATNPACC